MGEAGGGDSLPLRNLYIPLPAVPGVRRRRRRSSPLPNCTVDAASETLLREQKKETKKERIKKVYRERRDKAGKKGLRTKGR